MPVDTKTDVKQLNGYAAASTSITDGPEDISTGVSAELLVAASAGSSATLFISTEGAVNLTIEFSPDGGGTWHEPAEESPISFDAAGEDVAYIEFDASMLRVTGSNGTGVDLDLRVTA